MRQCPEVLSSRTPPPASTHRNGTCCPLPAREARTLLVQAGRRYDDAKGLFDRRESHEVAWVSVRKARAQSERDLREIDTPTIQLNSSAALTCSLRLCARQV